MTAMEEFKIALFDLKMVLFDAVRPFLAPLSYFLILAWIGFATWKVITWLT